MGGGGGGGSFGYDADPSPSSMPKRPLSPHEELGSSSPPASTAGRKVGMKLGAKGTGKALSTSMLGAVIAEDGLEGVAMGAGAAAPRASASSSAAAVVAAASAGPSDPLSIVIEEKVVCAMSRDGACENMEVKGTLSLTVNSPDATRCKIVLRKGDTGAYTFQNHPNVNKPLFTSDGVLALKQADREFPTATAIGLLKWRSQHKDESRVPLTINCWPEDVGGGMINVNLEYTLQPSSKPIELNNVVITIPLGTASPPDIASCDGSHHHNPKTHTLEWAIDLIDESNASGTLEFNIAGRDSDAFFPVQVQFKSSDTLCDIDIGEVLSVADDSKIRFGKVKGLAVEEYFIR